MKANEIKTYNESIAEERKKKNGLLFGKSKDNKISGKLAMNGSNSALQRKQSLNKKSNHDKVKDPKVFKKVIIALAAVAVAVVIGLSAFASMSPEDRAKLTYDTDKRLEIVHEMDDGSIIFEEPGAMEAYFKMTFPNIDPAAYIDVYGFDNDLIKYYEKETDYAIDVVPYHGEEFKELQLTPDQAKIDEYNKNNKDNPVLVPIVQDLGDPGIEDLVAPEEVGSYDPSIGRNK